ncbi:fimbrial biogenesis chaperone [Providencia sp. wls1914]|uniref:fimbrial biogenesis chaperone n=1 Tax=Providencia sp. wls1914 TaxID=2675156 RepID=UPI0012B56DBF|nr:molecular chaperone [Providencia sp. wls1914]MTC72540.1 fimbria/pilus periplasmic chaperone [Providencia sp. wls1914]
MTFYRSLLTGSLGLFFTVSAMAGISLDSSRIVFHAADREQGQAISVTSSGQSTVPYLVKAQILGDVQGTKTQNIFSVTPSLFRLEPDSSNQLRVLQTGNASFAQDRESIFYLRVIALPSQARSENTKSSNVGGSITVSSGSVIKLFYRPDGLAMTQQKAMGSLSFSQQGQKLKVSNSTPYYISLSSLTVGGKRVAMSQSQQNTMIAPFSYLTYQAAPTSGKVTWGAINDYGVVEVFHGVVQ